MVLVRAAWMARTSTAVVVVVKTVVVVVEGAGLVVVVVGLVVVVVGGAGGGGRHRRRGQAHERESIRRRVEDGFDSQRPPFFGTPLTWLYL